MINVFVNAWCIAVNACHNKEMESFNNPTREVLHSLGRRRARLKRLHGWAGKRWGKDVVGERIRAHE